MGWMTALLVLVPVALPALTYALVRRQAGARFRNREKPILAGYYITLAVFAGTAAAGFCLPQADVRLVEVSVLFSVGGIVMCLTLAFVGLIVSWDFMMSGRHVRRGRLHICRQCDYDLTGNESGVCPECGLPVQTLNRQAQAEK
jgi:hypothetical protein